MNKKKLIALLICAAMSFASIGTLTACFKNGKDNSSSADSSIPTDKTSSDDSQSSEEEEDTPKEITDYVDFVVDVETGRDIRVLQLTDVQTISVDQKRYEGRVGGNSAADTFGGYERYIGQVIERYDPDFIIMTGDNTYGEFDDYGEQFLHLISFMDSFEIPWAPVFGNHDNESNMGVDWQCDQFEASEYCLFKQRELTGNGNYSVGLTQDGELKRVFYMLDSNGCGAMSAISLANGHSKTSAGFGDDQIEWYSESMEELIEAYPETKLSMAFHIQISVFENAFKQYGYNASTIQSNPIDLDTLETAQAVGDFGYIGRAPKGPWDYNHKVWNTILEYGVDSVFVGHEHCNSASISYQGVRLTYGQKSSTFDRYNSNANGPVMGGTYINLSEADGSIADAGLYLYDAKLGYENPDNSTEEETKITIDNIPEWATVTEFDFNGTDFDTTVSTDGVKPANASKVTDFSGVPAGYTGDVYGYTTSDFGCVGIKFPQVINADRLKAVFVKMYVTDYTVTSGKTPLLRIYNDTANSILIEKAYSQFGGESGKWVYADILELIQGAKNIILDGKLNPFTFLYRFYGATVGTVYFDSITMVSDGDLYTFDEVIPPAEGERPFDTVRGGTYYQYALNEFTDAVGVLSNGKTKFVSINEDSYSLKFNVTPESFSGQLCIYGYTSETKPQSGICVNLTSTIVRINNSSGTQSFNAGAKYEVEVGFVKLFNGNTVYVFVKVNGKLVAWELVETYGKTAGNVSIVSKKAQDSFTLS